VGLQVQHTSHAWPIVGIDIGLAMSAGCEGVGNESKVLLACSRKRCRRQERRRNDIIIELLTVRWRWVSIVLAVGNTRLVRSQRHGHDVQGLNRQLLVVSTWCGHQQVAAERRVCRRTRSGSSPYAPGGSPMTWVSPLVSYMLPSHTPAQNLQH